MTQKQRSGAVLYAKAVTRVTGFYAQITGLTIVREEKDHVVMGSPAFQLVVVEIPPPLAATITIGQSPARRENTPIKLVFFVTSIADARHRAVEPGGMLNPADQEWQFGEDRVCDGHDPEGNIFQLREIN